jgi:photosystem II stability/assembly factor-like uncharacterized protein
MRIPILAATILLAVTPASRAAPVPANAYQDLHWRMIGPFRGGRTRAASGVASQPNVYYVAQVNGGVWKTDDAGRTWRPIFDGQPTQSIGAVAVAPSNPNIIYVGSGEGLHRPDVSIGNGVYKSTDAGRSWTHLGLGDAQQIPQIAVDPKNPNRVFAAVLGHPFGPSAERGLFRSLDGGASWQKVLYRDVDTGASDVEIDPQHPEVVYAAMWQGRLGPWEDDNDYSDTNGGLFKSVDGGTTWKQLKTGLPPEAVQFDLAIAPSQPSRLYVALTTEHGDYASGKGQGLYRSDDAGATWTSITKDERALLRIGGGDLMVPVVDPKDPNIVYVASIVAMKSRDGGKTWTWLRGAPGGDDYQNLWINPSDPNALVLVGDQGAVVTVNGGRTWSSWYNQPTAQLYHVGISADVPYQICSGQQESGSVCIASRSNDGAIGYRDWRPVGASEYGYVVPDPRNPDVVFGAGRNEVSRFQRSTGRIQDVTPIPIRGKHRVERTQPLIFSPVQNHLLYYASEVLWSTTNGGETWQQISGDLAQAKPGIPTSLGAVAAKDPNAGEHRGAIYAVAPSHKTAQTIWAGTDDGKIWVTRTGGKAWADITPPSLTPWSKVTQLDASHFDDTTVYASVSRFRVDDLTPLIYKTHDGGKTWTLIASGLPASPVNAVREDPVRAGLLYAATENGVWVSFDDGADWQSLQLNLPATSVRDLVVHGDDLVAATHGRGFWILDEIAALRQIAATMPDTLFKPAVAYRMPRSLYPDTPVPPDEPLAENPPTGAILDYYLAQPGPVTLEIVDEAGKVVRRFTSADPPELSDAELASQLIPAYWVQPRRTLGATAGMHRWVWDLRRDRPLAVAYTYPITAAPHDTPRTPEGARVPPDRYTVRLVANGKTLTQSLDVRLDPRIRLTHAQAIQLAELERKLADLVTQTAHLALEARSTSEQLEAVKAPQLKPQIELVLGKLALLATGPKPPPIAGEPPLTLHRAHATANELYRAVSVDAAPTAAMLAAIGRLERDAAAAGSAWTALKAELVPLNATLKAAGLPEVKPELRPRTTPVGEDVE